MNKFYALHRKLRMYVLCLGLGLFVMSLCNAHVIDIEFHTPNNERSEHYVEEKRGWDLMERRASGDSLSESEERECNRYEMDHMS